MEDTCIVCERPLGTDKVLIKSVSRQSLIKLSLARGDGKVERFLDAVQLYLHSSCKKSYATGSHFRKDSSKEEKQNEPLQEPAEHHADFDFSTRCFVCGGEASDETISQLKYRNKPCDIRKVTTPDFQNNLISRIDKASPSDYLDNIKERISFCNNFVSAKARYHAKCNRKLESTSSGKTEKIGKIEKFIVHTENFFNNHNEECQFTFSEIVATFEDDAPVWSSYLKAKLTKHFDKDLVVHQMDKDIIFTYRKVKKILAEHFKNDKQNNSEEGRLKLVETAAQIIYEDIKARVYPLDSYEVPQKFFDNVESEIPESLRLFLDHMIQKPKKGAPRP